MSLTITCPNCGNEFDRDEALSSVFDGATALYQCPLCGTWTDGPPPG
ncbi:MAG TPA: hypothetical protein VFJ06_01870 [Halococcus sp.]|nr:hypothetical protein [Halococcus sp.]